jgi:branched-subunit amino acid transport protein AzlD
LQTFKFYQVNFAKAMLLYAAIMFCIFILPFLIFGPVNVADFVYFVGAKGVIILVAVLVWPILKIKKYFSENIHLTVDQFNLVIRKAEAILYTVPLKDIASMEYRQNLNLNLSIHLNNGNEFFRFRPRLDGPGDREITKNIISAIQTHINFKTAYAQRGKSIFKYPVTVYTRDH